MIKYACWKRIIFRIFSRYFFECYFFLHPVPGEKKTPTKHSDRCGTGLESGGSIEFFNSAQLVKQTCSVLFFPDSNPINYTCDNLAHYNCGRGSTWVRVSHRSWCNAFCTSKLTTDKGLTQTKRVWWIHWESCIKITVLSISSTKSLPNNSLVKQTRIVLHQYMT